MNEAGNFNILNTKSPTNKTLNVVFSPSANVKNYTYIVTKDSKEVKKEIINNNAKIDINLEETGTYKITVTVTLNDGKTQTLNTGYYVIDKVAPEIKVNKKSISVKKGNIDYILNNIKATDNYDSDVTSTVTTNYNELNKNTQNTQKLVYTAIDRAGNTATEEISIKIMRSELYNVALYSILFLVITLGLILLSKYRKALKLEKRIEKFSVKPVSPTGKSISEQLIEKYQQFTKKISKNFDKSAIAPKYAKRLEKYLPVTTIHKSGMDIFAGKLIVGFVLAIIAFIFQLIRLRLLGFLEIVVVFAFGFIILDILYFIKLKIYQLKLENDFISAITIMNNAFKSGRSITQAIDIVAKELKGPMGNEFERMNLELLYGLELDVVFKRFSERIKIEEASYLTASLTILNKTGGDIIKVFDTIERSMFDKRKLRLELASLTSGSKIIVGVLLGMPFFFVLVISLINPEYFSAFITTPIGRILLIFMLIYYIIFVVVVRKVMKVVI